MMFQQDRLEEMGEKIQNAMESIDTIVRFPQFMKDVKFSDEPAKSVFDEKTRVLTFQLTYVDSSEIKDARRIRIEEYEKELERELAALRKTKEGL